MRKYIPLLLILLLGLILPIVFEPERPTEQVRGTVVDLAMDDGLPYIGISCDDGSGLCVYIKDEDIRPEDLRIGDRVSVIYEMIPLEHGQRLFAITVMTIE